MAQPPSPRPPTLLADLEELRRRGLLPDPSAQGPPRPLPEGAGAPNVFDSLLGAAPELAGLAGSLFLGPAGAIALPMGIEALRAPAQGDEASVLTTGAVNALPLAARGLKYLKPVGESLVRSALSSGRTVPGISRLSDDAIKYGADIARKGHDDLIRRSVQMQQAADALPLGRQKAALLNEIGRLDRLADQVAKAVRKSESSGTSVPRLLAGGGAGGVLRNVLMFMGLGMSPAAATMTGLPIAAAEASTPARMRIGRLLARGAKPVAKGTEAALRATLAGVSLANPRLRSDRP